MGNEAFILGPKSQAENLTPFVVAEQWEMQPHVNAVSLAPWEIGAFHKFTAMEQKKEITLEKNDLDFCFPPALGMKWLHLHS